MRILPNQVFLHEEDRFEPNTVYEVDDQLGFYFCANGWSEAVDTDYVPVAEDQPPVADLDIHSAKIQPKDSNG